MNSIEIIGWFFLIASIIVLGLGAVFVMALTRANENARKQLANNVLNEIVIFGIWIAGLAGSVGVLQAQTWGRVILLYFCIVLIVLCLLVAFQRGYTAWKAGERQSLMGIAIFLAPILIACGAAIVELRGAEADAYFSRR